MEGTIPIRNCSSSNGLRRFPDNELIFRLISPTILILFFVLIAIHSPSAIFHPHLSLFITAIFSSHLRVLPVPSPVLHCVSSISVLTELSSSPLPVCCVSLLLMRWPSVSTHSTLIISSYLPSSKSNVPSPLISHEQLLNTHFAVPFPFGLWTHWLKILCLDYFSAPISALVCLSSAVPFKNVNIFLALAQRGMFLVFVYSQYP